MRAIRYSTVSVKYNGAWDNCSEGQAEVKYATKLGDPITCIYVCHILACI